MATTISKPTTHYVTRDDRARARRKRGISRFCTRDGIRYKTCTVCGNPKPYDNDHYGWISRAKEKLRSECKECRNAYDRPRRRKGVGYAPRDYRRPDPGD